MTGTTRWSDGTEMVTLDYSHLTSVLWGVCKGFRPGPGAAYFAERTIKEAMLRRIAAGAGRRGQWRLMLADILSQINGRKHATTQVAPNLAYSDPEMAEIALRNTIESRGSYRVNEIAWSEKVYRFVSAKSGEMGLEVQSRQRRTERLQAPTSVLTLRVRLYDVSDSSACRRFGAARRALVISGLPIFPAPVPRDVALELAQGKLSPLCARGRGAKSRADLAHLFQDFPQVLGILELARKASGFHERAVQLLIEKLDAAALVRALGLKQRILAREAACWKAAGPSEQPQGRDRPPTQRASPGAMPARTGRPWRKSSL